MHKLILVLQGTPQSRERYDDDMCDRINHRYTGALLILFAIVTSTNQLVGDNINCWVPAHFSDPWADYTNQYCWIRNTYYLAWEDHIPKEHQDDKRHMIPYYQWVPLILLGQAFLFFMPCLFWRTFNNKSGLNMESLIEEGWSFYESDTAHERKDRLGRMVRQFSRYLKAKSNRAKGCTTSCSSLLSRILCPVCGKDSGNYLTCLYIIVKVFYLCNVIMQIFMLDKVMGYEFHFYGIHVIYALINGEDWSQSHRFPRVTMCDFKTRFVGNTQRYSVQCALPINLFNEKIFLFLWFWFALVATITLFSLITWLLRFFFTVDHEHYIRNHLAQNPEAHPSSLERRGLTRDFIRKYLRTDGIFVLRMIGHNVDGTTVNEFIKELWNNYPTPGDKNKSIEEHPTPYRSTTAV